MVNWEKYRANYPLVAQGGYFNTASFGAISNVSLENQQTWLQDMLLRGNQSYAQWLADYQSLKADLAKYIHAMPDEVAFFTDVSDGINKLAECLQGKREVVLVEGDFPSVTLPWINRRYAITWITQQDLQDTARLSDVLKTKDKILCVSWVFYTTGFKTDVEKIGEICRQYDCLFALDATQGLGASLIDVKAAKVDFMVASAFKWLMAGYGVAVGYVSRKLLHDLPVVQGGSHTLKDFASTDLSTSNLKTGADRFETGHPKFQAISMLKSSFDEMQLIGTTAIAERAQTLAGELTDQLIVIGKTPLVTAPANRSSIVSIAYSEQTVALLKDAGIIFTARSNYIRFAVYFYNNTADVAHLIHTLNR